MWEFMQKHVIHAQGGVRDQGCGVSGRRQKLAVAQNPVARAIHHLRSFREFPLPGGWIALHNVDFHDDGV